MYKIGVVGDRDSILGFKALGLDVFPVLEPDEASGLINKMARENYAVIFIIESVAAGIHETIDRYKNVPFPAIIPIPGNQGSLGLGIEEIKKNVEKAIGADILFGDK
ncbi:MAG: V-type ATP synthase subunit F [Clostridiales bacterium]|nr:V-type ATP synthase subunit F [Clostridiales bacterium]